MRFGAARRDPLTGRGKNGHLKPKGSQCFPIKTESLPVVTYHYVNNGNVKLNTPPSHFEDHCRVLAENGWRGVRLDEAEAFLLHGESLPRKSVLLTFDDGYLDNYVYAWPILRKYGHKGVIFPAAGFVSEA